MKTIFLALLAPAIGTVGQLLLKHVMRSIGPIGVGEIAAPKQLALALCLNPQFLLATALYFCGFVIWLVVLSRLDLSLAYPILALSYFLVPLLSWLLFGEHIPAMRWCGIGIICVGVCIVGLSQ
jgi:drug/metabolite transporter (DMT)-like permease